MATYNENDENFLAGVCAKCRSDLQEISALKKNVQCLPFAYDLQFIAPKVSTRTNPFPLCYICETVVQFGAPLGRPSLPKDKLSLQLSPWLITISKSLCYRGRPHKCNVSTLRAHLIKHG